MTNNLKIALYTCITSRKDNFIEQRKDEGIDYFLFTDEPDICKAEHTQIIDIMPAIDIPADKFIIDIIKAVEIFDKEVDRHRAYNLLLSQKIRILAPTFDVLKDYGVTIWIDGAMFLQRPIQPLIDDHINGKELMFVFEHRNRNCVYQEIEFWEQLDLYFFESRNRAMKRYIDMEFPYNYGLWGGSFQMRDHRDGKLNEFLKLWWDDIINVTFSDQISLPFMVHRYGFPLKSIGIQYKELYNKHFIHRGHLWK
jgi:hypothetical protein